MVSGSVSPFSSKCFSPFPHGTGSLSVSREYLALPGGPGGFRRDYSCPALLRIPLERRGASGTGLSPSTAGLSRPFPSRRAPRGAVLQPRTRDWHGTGLGSSPVARRYWGNHCLFSLPRGTKMFQFPRFASALSADDRKNGRVAPFGNPRIKGHLRLPAAYRSLSRPSSPP